MTDDEILQAALRTHTDYGAEGLDENGIVRDPFEQLALWLAEAAERGVYEPNAMALATIDPDGAPSIRTVLLRRLDEHGLAFYTDYNSRKGRALLAHPDVAAVFPWYVLHRQVTIAGRVERTGDADSDDYFSARPRGAQVAAWASEQSHPIADRAALEQRVKDAEHRFEGTSELPRPERWGGFRIVPHRLEFWQGRTSRLHDRLVFEREPGLPGAPWQLSRLQP